MPDTLADLLAQLSPPAPVNDWYSITNEASEGSAPTRAKVNIYDAIGGWWGTNARDFVTELDGLDVDELEVHVNSPGGAVWDGIAIMNSLKAHRARVTVIVDGLAASAASIVAMAGDEVVMAEGSQMMVHQASGGAWGNADFMRDTAAILDKIDANLAGIYARKAGGTAASWLTVMQAETWYNADEAVAAGLAHRTTETSDTDAEAAFDLSRFTYAGRSHAPAPLAVKSLDDIHLTRPAAAADARIAAALTERAQRAPQAPASTSEPGPTNRKGEPVVDEFLQTLRQRLGVQNSEASAEDILAALDEALAEQAPTVDLPPGVVAIDSAVLDGLKADAAAGRAALDAQIADRRDATVTAALKAGKITPATRDQWRASLDKDEEGITALLATMAATVNLEAKASAGGLDAASDEDALYDKAWGSTQKES